MPLIVKQPSSPAVQQWMAQDPEIAIWTLTPVEIVSALRRLVRSGQLEEDEANRAESLLIEFAKRCHLIIDVELVKAIACRVLRVHSLRAADALQLGAALAWAGSNTQGSILHTFDQQLAIAAGREGFESPRPQGGSP